MKKGLKDILSNEEICVAENYKSLNHGMNFRFDSPYSLILISQKLNDPNCYRINDDGKTIEYEEDNFGKKYSKNSKEEVLEKKLERGKLTQNGFFIKSVCEYRQNRCDCEIIKVYEETSPKEWSLKGYFNLVDYKIIQEDKRDAFRYILKLSHGGILVS